MDCPRYGQHWEDIGFQVAESSLYKNALLLIAVSASALSLFVWIRLGFGFVSVFLETLDPDPRLIIPLEIQKLKYKIKHFFLFKGNNTNFFKKVFNFLNSYL